MASGLAAVPSREDVSSLYLREYINGHRDTAKQLHAAFDAKSDLAEMCLALKNVVICQPVALTDQIRLAATVNLMRQQVLQAAEHLDTPPYRQKQSLDRMSGDRRAPVHRG